MACNCDLSLGQCATLAILWESAIPKPGNVHRGADFEDLSYYQFATAAAAIGLAIDQAPRQGVGRTLLAAVQATRATVATNTNLGTLLLIVPLACVPREVSLAAGINSVLAALTPDDARCAYEAIALAEPGGMGQVDEADISGPPPADLVAAMRLAADRDRIARQYAHDFADLWETVLPTFERAQARGAGLASALVETHLRLMALWPDSLIARKCGPAIAQQSAALAQRVLAAGPVDSEDYLHELAEFDFWLRSDHHRRNPGTTADLVAAGLFVALREGIISAPYRF